MANMIRSDHFTANISFNLSDVFSNKFTDVTLVSDDKILFNAHRYVLGVCSPVLKNFLLNNPHGLATKKPARKKA